MSSMDVDCLTRADHGTLRKWYRHIDVVRSSEKNMSKMIEGTNTFYYNVELQDPKVSRVTKPDYNNTCTSVLLHMATK